MFSDADIKEALNKNEIGITPFYHDQLQPASYDLRLGPEFLGFAAHNVGHIDPAVNQTGELYEVLETRDGAIFVHPGQFVIATSLEEFRFSSEVIGRVEGKSSLGRLGLLIHATAGFMDPGFEGEVTLEITNVAPVPIKLYCGMPIAQMAFDRLDTPAHRVYRGKYQGQVGPQPSRYYKNFEPGGPMHNWSKED